VPVFVIGAFGNDAVVTSTPRVRRAAATLALLMATTLGLLAVAHLDALRAPGAGAGVTAELTAKVAEVDDAGGVAPARLVPLTVLALVVVGLAGTAGLHPGGVRVEGSVPLPSLFRAAPRRRRAPPS
jgi:hypothetical protein